MKKIICIIVIAVLAFSALSLSLSAAPADTVIENLSTFNDNFSVSTTDIIGAFRNAFAAKPQLIFYYNGMSYTVYSSRTDCEVEYTNTDIAMNSIRIADSTDGLYNCLRSAMMNAETSVNVVLSDGKDLDVDFSALIDQIQARDYIAFMGYSGVSLHKFSNNHSDAVAYRIEFTYGYDSATLIQMKQETRAEVAWLTSAVFTPELSEYDLVKSIHDYLIDNTVYNESSEQMIYYAYGPLIKGSGVCEGYAEAARLLFDAVGIESLLISGTVEDDVPHAWNLVKIGGNWYQLDITWDDPVAVDGRNLKTYDYFNITDTEMAFDHVWSGSYPLCTVSDRGINATQTAVRPQSRAESSAPSSIESSAVVESSHLSSTAVSSKPSEPSSPAVSLQRSSAASQPPSSMVSSNTPTESTAETLSEPVLPTFPATNSKPIAEQSGFQLSELIETLADHIGLSVPIVTTLLFVLLAALALIIVYLMFRRK